MLKGGRPNFASHRLSNRAHREKRVMISSGCFGTNCRKVALPRRTRRQPWKSDHGKTALPQRKYHSPYLETPSLALRSQALPTPPTKKATPTAMSFIEFSATPRTVIPRHITLNKSAVRRLERISISCIVIPAYRRKENVSLSSFRNPLLCPLLARTTSRVSICNSCAIAAGRKMLKAAGGSRGALGRRRECLGLPG